MSDPLVVAVFEARLALLAPGVPYLRTLNIRPPDLPDAYVSLERDYATVDRITIGVPTLFREQGSLSVVVNTRAGTGVTPGDTIAEQVRALFHNFNQDHLHVQTVGSAVVFDPDDGSFFQLKVPVQYQFDFNA